MSPHVTTCHHMSPHVTTCHHMSPHVTTCHHCHHCQHCRHGPLSTLSPLPPLSPLSLLSTSIPFNSTCFRGGGRSPHTRRHNTTEHGQTHSRNYFLRLPVFFCAASHHGYHSPTPPHLSSVATATLPLPHTCPLSPLSPCHPPPLTPTHCRPCPLILSLLSRQWWQSAAALTPLLPLSPLSQSLHRCVNLYIF
jgi:hypothetical protein